MLRAFFFSGGLFVALWGVSFLMVDKMVLTFDAELPEVRTEEFRGLFMQETQDSKRVINPPDWAAFFLMSLGTVTMLYAVALPRRKQ